MVSSPPTVMTGRLIRIQRGSVAVSALSSVLSSDTGWGT